MRPSITPSINWVQITLHGLSSCIWMTWHKTLYQHPKLQVSWDFQVHRERRATDFQRSKEDPRLKYHGHFNFQESTSPISWKSSNSQVWDHYHIIIGEGRNIFNCGFYLVIIWMSWVWSLNTRYVTSSHLCEPSSHLCELCFRMCAGLSWVPIPLDGLKKKKKPTHI